MENTNSQNKWARIPAAGKELLGLKRSFIYHGINSGKIRAKSVRSKNSQRGITLVSLDDIEALIENAPLIKPKANI